MALPPITCHTASIAYSTLGGGRELQCMPGETVHKESLLHPLSSGQNLTTAGGLQHPGHATALWQ